MIELKGKTTAYTHREIVMMGLANIINEAKRQAARSKAERDKPGRGKVGAVGFRYYDHSGELRPLSSKCNCRACGGALEDENNVTLPDVIHAEMAVLLDPMASYTEYILCTESPCLNCAVHMNFASIEGVFWLEDYRLQDGVNYLISKGYKKVEFTVGDQLVKGLIDTASTKSSQFAEVLKCKA